jgi:diaminopimelate epimerase
MSAVAFHKMSGSGNDFVMLDGRTTSPEEWPPERVARICDRRHGIGGDGLVIVDPVGPDRVRMTYFNSDGSRAPMCGNAAICSTRLAAALELADPAGMTLETGAGSFRTRGAGQDLAELHLPDTDLPVAIPVELGPGERAIHLGVVGVPHVVVLVDALEAVDVAHRGRALRVHAACGPGGANVNFYSRIATPDGSLAGPGDPSWALRTYERGIEGETLSCGTGTVTAALAIAAQGLDRLPLRVRSTSGTTLSVSASVDGRRGTDIWLAGPGRIVARGEWLD